MFFSTQQINQSLKKLSELNPFFGTVFLALSEFDLPENQVTILNFISIVDVFLQKYYKPDPSYGGFYTPFKTSNTRKRWNTYQYANSLHRVTVDTFSDTIIHPKGTREWGWKKDYVNILLDEHLKISRIPAFDLAVWLFRTREWKENVQPQEIINTLLMEFHITENAKRVFDTTSAPFHTKSFQKQPVDLAQLLDIIGLPPEKKATSRTREAYTSSLFHPLHIVEESGAKLQKLKLVEVGPAHELEIDLADRLNLITGDNALGKTFILECAWWSLTGTWASPYPALPHPRADYPHIAFQIARHAQDDHMQVATYNWRAQLWNEPKKRNVLPGLTMFSQADGSFAVWDPAKLDDTNYKNNAEEAFIRINTKAVWHGLRENINNKEIVRCRGLIDDWLTWQAAIDQTRFQAFQEALKALSPHPQSPLVPGEPMRIPDEERDVRDIPTLIFPYGAVPITLCSAGIKRIVALAYLLIWAWHEHVVSSDLIRESPQRSIVLLIDEMEAHLHPFWQRVIVPAITNVIQSLSSQVDIQVIIATHSPLVLASVEPLFDEEQDKLFHLRLDLDDGSVQLNEEIFVKRGRVDQWLMSDIFGLSQPRSLAAEQTIEKALAVQLDAHASTEQVAEISQRLQQVLAPDDDFWPLWLYFAQQKEVEL
ncbi:AAA family ATPase [Tengunoibacter tsumagoiensis]|uniref:Uncharacterized protein n=1 Tax=Tengunoibacter tsumagoiensis TaxID=2014871 RepID=A0A402A5C5_9CHLR|nr:AAA family ATPase [Tengunoibacter tsumagoiensis]GCE14344.1 hypothetical protein KTT_42030 [Tengunoibacter tsumagoiensis]